MGAPGFSFDMTRVQERISPPGDCQAALCSGAVVESSPVAVYAYGIAATLRPREIVEVLAPAEQVRITKTFALVRYAGDAYAVAYDFGSVVFFDVAEADRERVMARILARLPAEPHPPLVDDFLVEVRPGAAREVTFDRAVVPDLEVPLVELVSLVLAQSVAMDYYDEDVEVLLARVGRLSAAMAEEGRIRGPAL
jgi:uncharacterized Rmd1/YagE family protein